MKKRILRRTELSPSPYVLLVLTLLCASSCSDEADTGAGAGGSGNAGTDTGGAAPSGGGGNGDGGASGGSEAGGTGGSAETGGAPGSGGATSGDEWAGCPTSEDYAATTGPLLEVTKDAVYCSMFNEHRSLEEELEAKAVLRIAPGSYPLPQGDEPDLALPICLRFEREGSGVPAGSGSLGYTKSSFDDTTIHNYRFQQQLSSAPDGEIEAWLSTTARDTTELTLRLDGTDFPVFQDEGLSYAFRWCASSIADCDHRAFVFTSCTHPGASLHQHEVELDTGTILLELRIGQSFASTEPGAFVRASGSFRGESFDQSDYFKLVYNPEHHHFVRDFAVLFDSPLGGACGVEVSGVDPYAESVENFEAYAIDCDLSRLEPLKVQEHTHTLVP